MFSDSFLFSVTNPDEFWIDMDKHMDFSNYEPNHPKFNTTNKAALGYFKDELCGSKKILEFIGLRPKCYSLNLEDKITSSISEKKICKGLGRTAIQKRLRFQQYKDCLEKKEIKRHDFATIRSTKHKVATIRQRKKVLTHFESKRFWYDCGIHSEPYGSYLIKKYYNNCPYCK
jgi:Zn/Cd-binding protein ZinT